MYIDGNLKFKTTHQMDWNHRGYPKQIWRASLLSWHLIFSPVEAFENIWRLPRQECWEKSVAVCLTAFSCLMIPQASNEFWSILYSKADPRQNQTKCVRSTLFGKSCRWRRKEIPSHKFSFQNRNDRNLNGEIGKTEIQKINAFYEICKNLNIYVATVTYEFWSDTTDTAQGRYQAENYKPGKTLLNHRKSN